MITGKRKYGKLSNDKKAHGNWTMLVFFNFMI